MSASAENPATGTGEKHEIMEAAKRAFTSGSLLAVGTALFAVLVGLTLVLTFFPKKDQELELERAYAEGE